MAELKFGPTTARSHEDVQRPHAVMKASYDRTQ